MKIFSSTFSRRTASAAFAFLLPVATPLQGLIADETKAPAIAKAPAKAADGTSFIRLVESDTGSRLQTGIASYTNADGVKVDLIGAIHLADPAYYDKLNERFRSYDELLYEMVADPERLKDLQSGKEPAEAAEPVEDPALRIIGMAQKMVENLLKLEGQKDGIDYTAKNFVHADVSPERMAKLQQESGESMMGLLSRAMRQQGKLEEGGAAPAEEINIGQLFAALRGQDGARSLKMMMARQFRSAEALVDGLEAEKGSVIISERNKVALAVLDKSMKKESKKNFGIFYGAAHLRDMEKRLIKRGFEKSSNEWLTAWDMPASPAKPAEK